MRNEHLLSIGALISLPLTPTMATLLVTKTVEGVTLGNNGASDGI